MTHMTQRSSDREAIEAEIDRIRSLSLDDLRILWRTRFSCDNPISASNSSCTMNRSRSRESRFWNF